MEEMPEVERYLLARCYGLDAYVTPGGRRVRLQHATCAALVDFCNEDLSAFYFDIRKDSLYCDAPGDARRRAARTVFNTLFHALIRYAAPVMVFTAEEVWGSRHPDAGQRAPARMAAVPRSVERNPARRTLGETAARCARR